MRVKTLLQLSIVTAFLLVLVLAAAYWSISARRTMISNSQVRAQSAAHDISDLLVLTHEYNLYSEERAAQQWKSLQNRIVQSLQCGVHDAVPPPPETLAELRLLPGKFQQLVTSLSIKSDLKNSQRDLLLDQLQSSSQVIADSIHHWGEAIDTQRQQIEHDSQLLAITIPLLMLVILALLTFLINRRVLGPLTQMNRAVKAVAKGDLTVRSATANNDEFGELSRTFDAMAIDLVSELQQENSIRKQTEEALANSERFLSSIIATEPECIKMLDINCNLLMMNPAGLNMIEAESFEQVMGQCVAPLITEPYRDDFISLTSQVFQGISGTLEFEIIGLKGRRVWLETHAVPFRNEHGEIVSLLGITRDITVRKEALDRVNKLEGIIPICMYCKKIRDDQNSWQQLEQYISEHSEALFSHGLCPSCAEEQMKNYQQRVVRPK